MRYALPQLLLVLLFLSCGAEEPRQSDARQSGPQVGDEGRTITFPDAASMAFFGSKAVGDHALEDRFKAPGRIEATVLTSLAGPSQHVILFDDPELTNAYTQLLQLSISTEQIRNVSIQQKQRELDRTKDLQAHGSATGQELLNAETELAVEQSNLQQAKAALLEQETRLRSSGFQPEMLQKAKAGTAFLICAIPESMIDQVQVGRAISATFTAFPDQPLSGKVDAIADQLDNATRMVKVRITLDNASGRLKTGMFAHVSFDMDGTDLLTIPSKALVTVQGAHYVFVQTSDVELERKEVRIGQQVGDRVIVLNGLEKDERVVINGVMQLKGLSFGY